VLERAAMWFYVAVGVGVLVALNVLVVVVLTPYSDEHADDRARPLSTPE
jgi:hypothetical protein